MRLPSYEDQLQIKPHEQKLVAGLTDHVNRGEAQDTFYRVLGKFTHYRTVCLELEEERVACNGLDESGINTLNSLSDKAFSLYSMTERIGKVVTTEIIEDLINDIPGVTLPTQTN